MAIEIVDLPIENGGSFHSYVSLPEGKQQFVGDVYLQDRGRWHPLRESGFPVQISLSPSGETPAVGKAKIKRGTALINVKHI